MSDVLDLPGADREQPDRPPAKVLPLGCVTLLDLDPDVVLENNKGRLAGFVFVGYDIWTAKRCSGRPTPMAAPHCGCSRG